ncbi:hypothetical protein TUM4261_38510 [Shewanella sp. c952]|nr:hypothetical protein TUM4261_38510 [Shewanella sp. c952]
MKLYAGLRASSAANNPKLKVCDYYSPYIEYQATDLFGLNTFNCRFINAVDIIATLALSSL